MLRAGERRLESNLLFLSCVFVNKKLRLRVRASFIFLLRLSIGVRKTFFLRIQARPLLYGGSPQNLLAVDGYDDEGAS